jgi:carbon monoxide dehydrogenase subunit G
MDFNGSHEFSASQSKVYASFFDTKVLAAAIPGCKEAKWVDPETLEVIADLNIPGIKGTFLARIQVTDRQEPTHLKLSTQRNNVRGSATVDLTESGGKTNLTYKGEADLSGPYKVADNVVGAQAAKMLLGQFFKQLEKQIGS